MVEFNVYSAEGESVGISFRQLLGARYVKFITLCAVEKNIIIMCSVAKTGRTT